ncbi:Topless-related protein 4 [Camellia lanceoleosa]|uniref:Topless-related protein 4 n=1 Tax=Camellia lanceoleosa TaxID=1840588 RepID=A0ACC0J3J2_9ERIC|nr:Topless-related protein 4 [Camellia lanceoleosa]
MLVSILCPDPHFKKRYHKRRALQKPLVESIVNSLMPGRQVVRHFWERNISKGDIDATGKLPCTSRLDQSSVDVPKTIEVVKPRKTSKIKEISEHARLQSLLLPSFVKKAKILKLTYTSSSSDAILALESNAIHFRWR